MVVGARQCKGGTGVKCGGAAAVGVVWVRYNRMNELEACPEVLSSCPICMRIQPSQYKIVGVSPYHIPRHQGERQCSMMNATAAAAEKNIERRLGTKFSGPNQPFLLNVQTELCKKGGALGQLPSCCAASAAMSTYTENQAGSAGDKGVKLEEVMVE